MKKLIAIFATLLPLTGCYDDYVKDYDQTGIYIAYQYDIRTFVVGEGMKFDIGVVLGGTINNAMDRKVDIRVDDNLVTEDLREFCIMVDDEGTVVDPFTALDGMLGNGSAGNVSQDYVVNTFKELDLNSLSVLPKSYYTLSNPNQITIQKGRHTGTVTVQADSAAFLSDANTKNPYYAFAFRIDRADADTVLLSKSFSVIAVRYENMLFGNYWHGGVTTIRDNTTGNVISTDVYPTTIPHAENRVYTLTTATPTTLTTNRLGNQEGSLLLALDGGKITVSSADASKTIEEINGGSLYNQAKLLQNRKLFLNYKYDNGDGTSTFVQDTLTFRNRIRDGVNEWQDENPENYQ